MLSSKRSIGCDKNYSYSYEQSEKQFEINYCIVKYETYSIRNVSAFYKYFVFPNLI